MDYSSKDYANKLHTGYISVNTIFVVSGIVLMLISELFADIRFNVFRYIDEIFCLLCVLFLFVNIIMKKRIIKYYKWFAVLLLIGFMGNFFYDVQSDFKVVAIDAFIFSKPYILFLYIIITIKESQAKIIYNFLLVISKIFIVILAFSSILTMFFDVGMVSERGFIFFSGFGGTISNWTILFLALVGNSKKNDRWIYYILSVIIIISADSGLGIFLLLGFLLIYLFIEKKRNFRWYYLILIVPICLWLGRNEIMGYLMNDNSPRYKLFYYSFITARDFFPLGAGFATYGSTTAISYYSKLYYKYRFNKMWGMSVRGSDFLMDSYYPQIIGQMGFIGFIIYVIFMYFIFKKFVWAIKNINIKCASIFLFVSWVIAGLGFGTISAWGCTVYVILAVLYLADSYIKEKDKYEII